MRRSQRLCFIVLSLFLVVGLAEAQSEVSLSILDIHSKPGGNVEMVVSVVGESGVPVKGLNKTNFRLQLEGEEVKEFSLEPVSSSKSPLSVILGIDVSGSMKGAPITEAKKAASIFLDQLDKEDFIALMVFGSSVNFPIDFTQKKHEVREKIEAFSATEMLTWLYQATYESVEKASKAPTARVAIVLLTDGKDEGSPKGEEDVLGRIKGAQVPIYTLGFGPKAQLDYLRKIAGMSGGYFFYTPNAEELSKLYSSVSDQLKNQYLLQFNFPSSVGEYVSTLTLNYQDKEITARRLFLHTATEPTPWWKGLLKNPVAWGVIALTIILVGLAILYGFLILRRAKSEPTDEGEEPEISFMIEKKIHPIGLSSNHVMSTATVAVPSASQGEVGLEIDMQQPLPLTFALIDTKNNREFEEVIITRFDEDRGHLLLQQKVYLLFSDRSVTRPDEEKDGHARIFIDAETGTYQIEDLGSTSGTKVNGHRLGRGVPLALTNGDMIMVGQIPLKYYDKRPLSETTF